MQCALLNYLVRAPNKAQTWRQAPPQNPDLLVRDYRATKSRFYVFA